MDKKRNSSVELLRIVSMMGVILLHYNNQNMGGAFKYASGNNISMYWLYFIESVGISAVNVFIIISSYYLCCTAKRRLGKIFELIAQLILFRQIFYIITIMMGVETLSFKGFASNLLPTDYFVVLYSVLYIVSPYINVCINNLSRKNLRLLICICFLIFSVWNIIVDAIENILGHTMLGLRTIGMEGTLHGYSIVNFILLYLIGAYIRMWGVKAGNKKMILSLLFMTLLNWFLSIWENVMKFEKHVVWNYENPLVILSSVCIFVIFLRLKFSSSVINKLAKASFICYLVHEPLLGMLHIENFINNNLFVIILHQIMSVIVLYAISYLIYIIYDKLSKEVWKKLNNKIDEKVLFYTES